YVIAREYPRRGSSMAVLKFHEARETVIQKLRQSRSFAPPELVSLTESSGRVLAESVFADRDFPPFPRSTRDGFALRHADLMNPPTPLRIKGQVKAGDSFSGTVAAGGG